jgi:hypothetical protein
MIDVKIEKDIPKKEILEFEDKVVYNCASLTREYVKGVGGFPHLSGRLEEEEISAPIVKTGTCQYGLSGGTTYATRVWNMNNVKWTNPNTIPQWYFNAFNRKRAIIIQNAINKSLKELNK